jgi:hypothetical protein
VCSSVADRWCVYGDAGCGTVPSLGDKEAIEGIGNTHILSRSRLCFFFFGDAPILFVVIAKKGEIPPSFQINESAA